MSDASSPRLSLPFSLGVPGPAGLRAAAPGLAAVGALALFGVTLQAWSGSPLVSPMAVAMVTGILLRNVFGLAPTLIPGIRLAMRPILRLGVILLGFRLTFDQLGQAGARGIAVIALTLAATFLFTKFAGRALGVRRGLSELIAAGTSVCGASAVLAVNTVTRAPDEDVAYAIACVTVFGSASMLLFPLLAGPLGFSPQDYGLWVGASVHEVAQVVGAGFAQGDVAGQSATVAKLGRVFLLAPLILALGFAAKGRGGAEGARTPTPWFVFGFIAVVALNSMVALPAPALDALRTGSGFLLTMALAAMGLETHFRKLRGEGIRPLLLGALAWAFVSLCALLLLRLL